MRRQADLPLAAIAAVTALALVPAFLRIASSVPLHVSLDNNEGWNAYHAVHALTGRLYEPLSPFFFNDYPPLSFYIVGAFARLTGDPIVAGRLIALVSLVALAGVLGAAARQMGCTRTESAFGGLLFLAVSLSLSHYPGIDDPHFLGQAVVSAGLLFVLREPVTTPDVWIAATLMTAGIFIKHSIVALPLVTVAWSLQFHPRTGRRLLIAGAALAAVAIIGGTLWFGTGLLDALFAPRGYSLAVSGRAFVKWIWRMPVVFVALIVVMRRFPRDGDVLFCAWYVAAASLVGLFFLGGAGVDWNAMFESNWACCLAAAVALNRLTPMDADRVLARRRALLACAFLALPLIATSVAIRRGWWTADYWLHPRVAAAQASADDIAFIAAQPGRAFCEETALCFWAGKPAEVDVFNLQQHVLRGRIKASDLLQALDRRDYAVVQINAVAPLLGPQFLDVLNRRYRVARERPGSVLFLPRP